MPHEEPRRGFATRGSSTARAKVRPNGSRYRPGESGRPAVQARDFATEPVDV